jgi:hypothetical protein
MTTNNANELVTQTENQRNPGAAKAEDFIIEDRDGGQQGDSDAERAALLAESEACNAPILIRNEVPHTPEGR